MKQNTYGGLSLHAILVTQIRRQFLGHTHHAEGSMPHHAEGSMQVGTCRIKVSNLMHAHAVACGISRKWPAVTRVPNGAFCLITRIRHSRLDRKAAGAVPISTRRAAVAWNGHGA